MANLNEKLGTCDYDPLFSGPNREFVRTITVTGSGSSFKRGELVTYADGKIKAIALKTDAVFGVVADPIDATSEDAPVTVFLNGDFRKEALSAANSVAVDDLFLSARNVGIIFR